MIEPIEKVWTDEELKSEIKRLKMSMSGSDSAALKKQHVGTEMFLDTEEGKVRILAYNLNNSQSLPLFVNIHGGGFVLGSAESDDPFMMNIADNANVKIINIDYSLAPEYPFPKALNECYAVIKYAKENWKEFNIDPNNIAVGGHSAGGNLSAAICLLDNERKLLGIKSLILDYAPMDIYTDASLKKQTEDAIPIPMCRLFDACYCNNKEARKNPLISPIYAAQEELKSFPPTLVITASRDSLCEEGEKFMDRLVEAGVDVTHKRFDAEHGFNMKSSPLADESWQLMINHLKRTLWGK
ncbi:alpha/beta hydrolase [Ruminiclostridium herbifermentans]|uniref:Alpha/beta hydrolase n=1 Tax=Ruminiclostridium herbifermentans TaxID=2488810 RepID=A0A7H1VQ81_9FIRM|nr:alpha/beta hydrolase [Ruminiclostridium herbifermentans]QNU67543.1 alpha/beta hydrolase [Ruminiclostridium herbifermentans]